MVNGLRIISCSHANFNFNNKRRYHFFRTHRNGNSLLIKRNFLSVILRLSGCIHKVNLTPKISYYVAPKKCIIKIQSRKIHLKQYVCEFNSRIFLSIPSQQADGSAQIINLYFPGKMKMFELLVVTITLCASQGGLPSLPNTVISSWLFRMWSLGTTSFSSTSRSPPLGCNRI